MPALRRSPKDQVESQTLKQEAVTLKLPWRLKDVKDARAMGYMLRKAANREWNQPRRKQFVAVNKDEKGKVMPALRRSPKDQVESQTLKQEAVTLKLPWRLKDVKDARAMGYMLRKAANREWNQPRRKQFVAVNKDEKGVEI